MIERKKMSKKISFTKDAAIRMYDMKIRFKFMNEGEKITPLNQNGDNLISDTWKAMEWTIEVYENVCDRLTKRMRREGFFFFFFLLSSFRQDKKRNNLSNRHECKMLHTQKSFRPFWHPVSRSSNVILQLATKSSGGMAASWKTVNSKHWALWTSDEKYSFHIGLKFRCLVVLRSIWISSTSIDTYGSNDLDITFTPCRVEHSVGRKSDASITVNLIVPVKPGMVVMERGGDDCYISMMNNDGVKWCCWRLMETEKKTMKMMMMMMSKWDECMWVW